MGTRADFYVGRGKSAEWLGSIAWDGYPGGEASKLFDKTTEDEFRAALANFAAGRDDWSSPAHGWPWPWDDSRMTDYAYAFDDGKVLASRFGRSWQIASKYDRDRNGTEIEVFPNMSERKNVTFGPRSGVIVIST